MQIHLFNDPQELGMAAGQNAARVIRDAILEKGEANIILATGASQFLILQYLVEDQIINWNKVVMFHLDEYLDLAETHNARFRKYLKERFLEKVKPLKKVYLISGNTDPVEECNQLKNAIQKYPIDLALVGIGENGHLAFNDPPADFETTEPYIVVNLDEACRMQQLNEGWFPSMDEVPKKAISMSVKQIMKSKNIISSVPDKRKAIAVYNCFKNGVSNLYPASILQEHAKCDIYLDKESAALLYKQSV